MVNADDFGFTPDVNRGIVEAHRGGILTATTLMANGEAFDDAVRLARETPSLDVGCHLVLIGGRSLVTGRPFPATVAQLLRALARGEIRLYDELAAQMRRIDRGRHPAHASRHAQAHASGAAGAGRGGAHRARSSAFAGCAGRSIFRCTGWAACRA